KGYRQREDLDTVLCVAAIRYPVITQQPVQSVVHVDLPSRMHIKKSCLSDRLRADVVIVTVLGAGFETASTGHAARVGISLLSHFVRHGGSGPKTVASV